MHRWYGLIVLLATTFVAAQGQGSTTSPPAPNTGNTRFGPGGLPFGGGGGGGFGFPQGVSPQVVPPPPFLGVGGFGNPNPQQAFFSPLRPNCRFFKRDQFGRYVCDVDQKPFVCPILRGECPRFGLAGFVPPQQCFNDNDCALNDKCCPDICFDHLICKGPE